MKKEKPFEKENRDVVNSADVLQSAVSDAAGEPLVKPPGMLTGATEMWLGKIFWKIATWCTYRGKN